MLKLLLNHWQTHREPAPFVLTDDPLYCSHLTSASKLPEVYSVNRVNPIYEEEDEERRDARKSCFIHHRRSLSEERRENETKSSDDTGYVSGLQKSQSTVTDDALIDDIYSLCHQMSSDSDDIPEALIVCADVHRVSRPDDIILPSTHNSNSLCSHSINSNSSTSLSSQEPYDSLSTSNLTVSSSSNSNNGRNSMKIGSKEQASGQTEVKRPASVSTKEVREKLQKLLEQGNKKFAENFPDSNSKTNDENSTRPDINHEIEKTKDALIKSLTRVLDRKMSKTESFSTAASLPNNNGDQETITRTDSVKSNNYKMNNSSTADLTSTDASSSSKHRASSSTSKSHEETHKHGVTRQDESTSSSSSTTKSKKYHHRHRHHQNHHEKRRNSSDQESDKNTSSRICHLCEEKRKPITLHQLLPGHWSYDNIYLPQPPGVCYHCLRHHHQHHNDFNHHNQFAHFSDDDRFYPMYHHNGKGRVRHSWAPRSVMQNQNSSQQHDTKNQNGNDDMLTKATKSAHKDRRYSPDGSSHETETESPRDSDRTLPERQSLRVPKKCKCEYCLATALDSSDASQVPSIHHSCPCCYLPHRRVKFASDTDLSKHEEDIVLTASEEGNHKILDGNRINGAIAIGMPHINGALVEQAFGAKDGSDGNKIKKLHSVTSRGQKEPVKVDDLYKAYPLNFQEWESNYRRTFLRKRRKTALNMIGMAIVIVLVVGVAIAMTFIFLRMKRPT